MSGTERRRVVIMGAAGRDFHNFNMVYRNDSASVVLAFTAAQIPGIGDRRYPPTLAGPLYPDGIPIIDEAGLDEFCRQHAVDDVVFAYSDVPYDHVMHKSAIAIAAGADFRLLGPAHTMLSSRVPVIAVSAVRTGVGKSQVSRFLSRILKDRGLRVVVIRHPMPYGALTAQAVQRFAQPADLDRANCTVEEREEYEPHLAIGNLVYAGADYARILQQAEAEADIILWDGGNNDYPFIRPDFHIVLVDPLRAGDETAYYPGEAVLRMTDLVVVAKTNSATEDAIASVSRTANLLAPGAPVLRGLSQITLDDPTAVRGRRVLVIEDGPTLTHGGMRFGAGYLAAREAGAATLVDPRKSAVGHIAEAFRQYPHLEDVLPALGYSAAQLEDLQATINGSEADVVVSGTPSDIAQLMDLEKPVVRARYEFAEGTEPGLAHHLSKYLEVHGLAPA